MMKPNIMAMFGLAVLASSVFMLPTLVVNANAQYGPGAQVGGGSVEEQLELAKSKIDNAKQAGAYGSGTPMLGTNINETILFIGILTAIFGGVAAAFFIKGRGAKAETAT